MSCLALVRRRTSCRIARRRYRMSRTPGPLQSLSLQKSRDAEITGITYSALMSEVKKLVYRPWGICNWEPDKHCSCIDGDPEALPLSIA
jgi:hypothetical protein